MFATVRQLPLFALLLVLAVGCGQNPSGNNGKIKSNATPCMQDSDCSSDGSQICLAGSCAANTCTSNSDCPPGETCSQLSSECVATDGGMNPGDGGSDAGTHCNNKDDCDFSQACTNHTCGSPPGTCGEDSQCGRGQICNFDQQCVVGCDNDQDCVSPATCNTTAFVCEGGPDAGPDAGSGGCHSNADCSGNSAMPICDTAINQCVQCTSTQTGACTNGQTCVTDTCTSGGSCPSGDTDYGSSTVCQTNCTGTCEGGSGACCNEGGSTGSCSPSCSAGQTCVDLLITSACAQNCSSANDCPLGEPCCTYAGSPTGSVCSGIGMCLGG